MATPRRKARGGGGSQRAIVTTTVRIYRDQRDALQQRAMKERTAGRADASAVLRDVLDRAGLKS